MPPLHSIMAYEDEIFRVTEASILQGVHQLKPFFATSYCGWSRQVSGELAIIYWLSRANTLRLAYRDYLCRSACIWVAFTADDRGGSSDKS